MGKKPLNDLLRGKGDLLQQDAVLFPCNSGEASEHWFLGVVLPKKRCIVVFDSLPGEFIKPTEKMMSFLQKIDQSIDINQWSWRCSFSFIFLSCSFPFILAL